MISLIKRKIAIRYIQDSLLTKSGLHLPDTTRLRSDQGIVKYVGPDQDIIKPGMYVVYDAWTGTTAHIEGENGLIILADEESIVCELHPPATQISGLYHKNVNGEYFPATYESSIELIREQYDELPRFANLKNRSDPNGVRSVNRG